MSEETLRALVRGYVYRCVMFNGADFEIWSPTKLTRKEARARLFALANGDYPWSEEDPPPYEKGDMDRMWEARS